MDSLTNECQQLVMEVLAKHGAPNNPSTLAAARLIGEAFANKIRTREIAQAHPVGGDDFLSKEYATQLFQKAVPGYEPSKRGVFEDILAVLRQDGFLLRSLMMISEMAELDQVTKVRTVLKAMTT